MTATTLISARRTTWNVGLSLGSLAGLALAVAGIWNALIQEHITVASVPAGIGPESPPTQAMHRYYTWYAGTVAQERAATVLGLVGVVGLVLLAVELRARLASVLGRCACTALQVAGVVWAVGAVTGIGNHRAIGLMATHGNPIDTVNAIAFTSDVTADAFATAAFVGFGVGMLAVAATGFGARRWGILTSVTGVLSIAVAYGYAAGNDTITTYGLAFVAAVLTPAWLVWTGRLLDGVLAPSA